MASCLSLPPVRNTGTRPKGCHDTETQQIEPELKTAMEVIVVVLVGNQRAAALEAADVLWGH